MSPYYDLGYSKLGPFLGAFSVWLHDEIEKYEPRKVFFLSRDGYLMYKSLEVMYGDSASVESEYVNFSRKSIRDCILWKHCDFESLIYHLRDSRFVSRREVLSFFGLKAEESEGDVSLDETITFAEAKSDNFLRKKIEDSLAYISSESKRKYDVFKRYLAQIGFCGRIVIVDIGWRGSSQIQLEEIASLAGIEVEMLGLYMGIDCRDSLAGKCKGFLYNHKSEPGCDEIFCSVGLIEKLFQKREGSTVGYCEENGHIEPMYAPFEYTDDFIPDAFDEMQRGSLDFVAKNKPEAFCASSYIDFAKEPDLNSLELFKPFFHIDEGEAKYFLPQKSLFSYGFSEFKRALSDSPWKTGFLKAALKTPYLPFAIYKMFR